ncbi:MAG: DMT family transporter [Paraglaciecola sp.]|uniref:DMT family transporter n=1 Tax=Paraglaciecola sp. TaxID=1920173 RepID=UPI00273D8464|nr:DMT family transporter [Paraglaciecola sp.]MDP5029546.1 DMT family transporter [Paraglaciecola sp.]MDP5131107.1 DMT family transporter [Paraglaciecola sp.]
MSTLFAILILIIGGIALSVQSSINGRLGHTVGVIASAWLTFVIGFALTFLLFFFFEQTHTQTLFTAPKWQLMGAVFGVIYMVVVVFAVPRIGIAGMTVSVIAGQLMMSLLIDHFGWLNNSVIELDAKRYVAILLLLGAIVMVYLSNKRNESDKVKHAKKLQTN